MTRKSKRELERAVDALDHGDSARKWADVQIVSEDETSQDQPGERLPNSGQQLLRIDEDGTVRDPVPPEVREKFNDNLFSAVYDGGRILLQEVK